MLNSPRIPYPHNVVPFPLSTIGRLSIFSFSISLVSLLVDHLADHMPLLHWLDV